LLLGYWGLMAWVPIRDLHLDQASFARAAATTGIADERQAFAATTATVSGHFEPGYNLSDHVDFQYLPGHKWNRYYDPEGLLSTLPAIATCLLGVLAGLTLRSPALDDRRRLAWLVGSGVALVAVGWLWDLQFPVIKKIWSSSFVLVAGGWSLLLLALFHWLVDLRGWKAWVTPFVWIGMNAITAYLLVELINLRALADRVVGGPVAAFLDAHVATGLGAVIGEAGALGLVLLFVWYLHRRQIFLRL
jgi:predicted acyltransferase